MNCKEAGIKNCNYCTLNHRNDNKRMVSMLGSKCVLLEWRNEINDPERFQVHSGLFWLNSNNIWFMTALRIWANEGWAPKMHKILLLR